MPRICEAMLGLCLFVGCESSALVSSDQKSQAYDEDAETQPLVDLDPDGPTESVSACLSDIGPYRVDKTLRKDDVEGACHALASYTLPFCATMLPLVRKQVLPWYQRSAGSRLLRHEDTLGHATYTIDAGDDRIETKFYRLSALKEAHHPGAVLLFELDADGLMLKLSYAVRLSHYACQASPINDVHEQDYQKLKSHVNDVVAKLAEDVVGALEGHVNSLCVQ